ncbi:MAG: biopolymer transporter ExbD [Pirellulaceae bacterium]|nr:biopolymer transporter ExbD [Planctomycetales bacterium]
MPLKTTQNEEPVLNMTPMIDVVFLLIIFFMVGTKFTDEERNIKLQLPEVGRSGALSAAPEKKVVNIYRDGTITLDQRDVTLEQLTNDLQRARGEYADLGVAVRGDGEIQYKYVASVLGAVRASGVRDMAITVKTTQR